MKLASALVASAIALSFPLIGTAQQDKHKEKDKTKNSTSSSTTTTSPKPSKPTGACTISIYGISPTCTTGVSEDSCNGIASRRGGTASWVSGGSCK